MTSPISEVKPSQVNQLTAENAKLKEENEKLKAEIEDNKVGFTCLRAEREYIDIYVEDYRDFNKYLKENYKNDNNDLYKKMYDWFNMDDFLDEDEDEDK